MGQEEDLPRRRGDLEREGNAGEHFDSEIRSQQAGSFGQDPWDRAGQVFYNPSFSWYYPRKPLRNFEFRYSGIINSATFSSNSLSKSPRLRGKISFISSVLDASALAHQ
jgi:hypothetical protein